MSKNNFDVTEVARKFRNREYGADHVTLFNDLRRASIHNREWKLLLADIGYECLAQSKQPIDIMGLCLLYGMEIGVLLERERAGRKVPVVQ